LPAKQRVKDFQEAVLPLTAEEALEEASRCLRCDIRDNGTVVSHR
jgi:NADPH-dependent glutamate synthase beta subunit-like oxidoreductase